MKHKYLILDFGKVLVVPTTGDWDLTPKFLELIDMKLIDEAELRNAIKRNCHMFMEKIVNLEEEYDMFTRFYDNVLRDINYPNYDIELAKEIAYDRTYKDDKYVLCDDVINDLTELKKKYTLILLTDNWPCVIEYMKRHNMYDFFDKIYVSSVYKEEKLQGKFFDFPIKDYNIKPNEALFIDDNEKILDVAVQKGLDVLQMDRYKANIGSKYQVINDLKSKYIY